METVISGVKTHYEVIGEGTPFLILHGWGSNTERWREVADILSKNGFQVIIPDLPGFGTSEPLQTPWTANRYVKWADEFLAKLNLTDFYLMGHSFGGAISVKIAVKHSQHIKKLFLVSAAIVRKKTAKKGMLAGIAKIVKLFQFLPGYPLFRKAVYKFIIRKSDYAHVEGVMKETYLNGIGEDISFHLPFIRVPTVIIWGDKDESTPLSEGEYIHAHVKKSEFEVISGAGHDLNRKQPEQLTEAIIRHR